MVRAALFLLAGCLAAAGVAAHDHAPAKPAGDYARMWQERQEKAPRLAVAASFDAAGRLWLARAVGRHLQLSHSDDGGRHFSPPLTVNREPELIAADGEARPHIAVVGQRIYLSWTQTLPQPFAGHIRFTVSDDGGRTFAEPQTVNDHQAPITHRFNAMLADARGVSVAWIDKRDGDGRGDYRGAAIYTARSTDGGKSFAANRKLAEHSCECCRLAMVADADGTPVVFWRQIFERNIRDFAVARFDEAPLRASQEGWAIDACPHHGGALAVDAGGARHLAWFTGAEASPGLHYRRLDGGQMTVPLPFGNLDAQAGHPALLALAGDVHLVWREFDGQKNRILGMRSTDRGDTWSQPAELAATSGAADDPLLLSGRGAAWLLWNTVDAGLKIIRVSP